jgi:hypothetical protein
MHGETTARSASMQDKNSRRWFAFCGVGDIDKEVALDIPYANLAMFQSCRDWAILGALAQTPNRIALARSW